MIILNEETDVLNLEWRKNAIKQIESSSNKARKNEALKRFEIYRDKTKKWVFKSLKKQNLSPSTLDQMEASVSNISICKKVVNKLAKVYQTPPTREVDSKEDQEKIEQLVNELDFNTKMSKTNRYLELFKNALVYVMPKKNIIESLNTVKGKIIFDLDVKVLSEHMYDPILDSDNQEVSRGFILSDFVESMSKEFDQFTGARSKLLSGPKDKVSGVADIRKEFIFTTNLYHFTTNHKAEIIESKSPKDNINPILMLPMTHFNYDTDGEFFAQGGDDLIDGSISINLDLTNMTAIANIQGYGQIVIVGNNLPTVLEFGPHTALKFEIADGQEKPTVEILSANPPIDQWMAMIEQKTALLLSTNNLSPRNVSTKLDVASFPSGISQLIEQSEITFDIEDKQKVFKDNEPVIWEVIRRWIEVLLKSDQLSNAFKEIGPFKDSDVRLMFSKNKAVVTEGEKLDNLKKRKELNINLETDLLIIDNPELSQKDAKNKLDEIKKQNEEKMNAFMGKAINNQDDDDKDNQGDDDDNGKGSESEI